MVRLTVLALALIALACWAQDDGLLLYAPFDDAGDAAIAGGDPRNLHPEQSLVKGALVLDRDCEFRVAGNFRREEGTVALWIRPHWDGDAAGPHQLFCLYGQRDLEESWARNRWNLVCAGGNCTFSIYPEKPGKALHISAPIGDWLEGMWRQLAITWRNVNSGQADGEMRLYIDGKLVAQLSGKRIDVGPTHDAVAIGRDQDASPDYAQADVDELFVYSRALTEGEIAAAYTWRTTGGVSQRSSAEPRRWAGPARVVEGWWNTNYPYRAKVTVAPADVDRDGLFVQCPLHIGADIAAMGLPASVAPGSIRVVDEAGTVLASRIDGGLLEWQATGVTPAGEAREFEVYAQVLRYVVFAPLQARREGGPTEPGPELPPAPDYATLAYGKPWDFEDGSFSGIDQWGNKPEFIQNRKVEDGILSMDVEQDPWFIWGDMWGQVPETNRRVNIDLDRFPILEMRVRQSVNEATWELFGRPGTSARLLTYKFPVRGTGWQRIRINLQKDAGWHAVLSALRIDPTSETKAHVEIDWVRLSAVTVANHDPTEALGEPSSEPARVALSVPQARVQAGARQEIAALVENAEGKPVSGQPVIVELVAGSGGELQPAGGHSSLGLSSTARRGITDPEGRLRVKYVASRAAQENADTVVARLEFAPPASDRKSVDTIPGPAHHYRVSPVKVATLREADLPLRLTAQLVDEFDNPVAESRAIAWETDAPGSLVQAEEELSAQGVASAQWTGDEGQRWVYTVRVQDESGLAGESAAICLLPSEPREDPVVLGEDGRFHKGVGGPAWFPLGGFYANWVGVDQDGEEGRRLLSFVDATEEQIEHWLEFLASQGVTSLRFMLRAHTPRGMEPMDVVGRVNMPLFAKVLRYMDLARKHDIRFMLTIHEDYTKPAYYSRQALETFCIPAFAGEDLDALPPHQRRFIRDRNTIDNIDLKYTDPDVMACQDQYARELIGLLKDNPQLFSWEFENEMVDCPQSWANHAAAVIRSVDPVTPICASHGGGGIATADPLWWTKKTDIDFYTYHIYPNTSTTLPELDYGAAVDLLTCYGRMAGVCMLGESAGDEWSRYPREGDDDRRYVMRDIIWFSLVNGNPGCYFWNARGFEVEQFRLAKEIAEGIDWEGWVRRKPAVGIDVSHPWEDDKYYRTRDGKRDYAMMGRYVQHYLSTGVDFDFTFEPEAYDRSAGLAEFAPPAGEGLLNPGAGWQARVNARDDLRQGLAYVRNFGGIKHWDMSSVARGPNLYMRERRAAPLRIRLGLGEGTVRVTATDLDTGLRREFTVPGDGELDLGTNDHDWAVVWRGH